jgi:hypothetical protein
MLNGNVTGTVARVLLVASLLAGLERAARAESAGAVCR